MDYVRKEVIVDKRSVLEKLDALFNGSKFVFSTRVIIKTKDNRYDTKIIARKDNSILTYDDVLIPIDTITDIIIKDR